MQACCAGLCAGVQVYLLGAGLAAPLCRNSAWLAALFAVPVCAGMAALCRWASARGSVTRMSAALTAAACLLCAVSSCASLSALAEVSLLPRARPVLIGAMTAGFVLFCAASGAGVTRLAFLLRSALPAVLLAGAFFAAPDKQLSGVFPLLGAGAGPLALAASLMATACAPLVMLLVPPPELVGRSAASPAGRLFAWRAAIGAGVGSAMLFLLCAGSTPQALSAAQSPGARLAMIAGGGAHQGLADTALLVAMTAGAALHASVMLRAGSDALSIAFPRMGRHAGLFLLAACLFTALLTGSACGIGPAQYAAPIAALPAAGAVLLTAAKKGDTP